MTSHARRLRPTTLAPIISLGRCFVLLIVLVAMVLVQPALPRGAGDEPGEAARWMFALVPLAAVYALSGRRWTLIMAIALAVPALIAHIGAPTNDESALSFASAPLNLIFGCFVTGVTIAYALTAQVIVRDRLFAAASAYHDAKASFAHRSASSWPLNHTWAASCRTTREPA